MNEELEAYLRGMGLTVETVVGTDRKHYIVIRDYVIPSGTLAGKTCDVGIERVSTVPYVFPSAIHTLPAMVEMSIPRYNTQPSKIADGWQYWSRVIPRQPPTPALVIAHIATIFSKV